ncbi:hypothetical protein BpJC4_30340 [Weizmannia acidilactici]|nr:hypothetical protein BpJC4_30340 [Weizmannia acidilactici]
MVDSWKDPIGTLDINLMSAAYLLEAIRKVNSSCKILIAGSALQIDPVNLSNIPHPYSLSKTLQEIVSVAWKKLFKMNIVITKPTNLIGPGCSNGINSIIASKIVKMERNEADPILIVNNLNATRDFLDVRDAVNAYEILLNKGESGEVYDICTGISRTIREMIDIYKNLTDVNLEVKATSNQSGSEVETRKPSKLFELGWKPSIPFEASLRDTIEFFRTNPEICI